MIYLFLRQNLLIIKFLYKMNTDKTKTTKYRESYIDKTPKRKLVKTPIQTPPN